MAAVILHGYFRSSTSFRVRATLNIKKITYQQKTYPLLEAAHQSEAYLALNPQGLVPSLQWSDGQVITQSLAIMEFLEEIAPTPSLLPETPAARAYVRSLTQIIASDIHPVNNLRILQHLESAYGQDKDALKQWFQRWAICGFEAFEARLDADALAGQFCYGEQISFADIALTGQYINNQRFDVDMSGFPRLSAIAEHCLTLQPIIAALPQTQPDAF